MKTSTLARILAPLCTASLLTFICWCGGFNFDTRNFEVGYITFITIMAAVASACLPWEDIFFN